MIPKSAPETFLQNKEIGVSPKLVHSKKTFLSYIPVKSGTNRENEKKVQFKVKV